MQPCVPFSIYPPHVTDGEVCFVELNDKKDNELRCYDGLDPKKLGHIGGCQTHDYCSASAHSFHVACKCIPA